MSVAYGTGGIWKGRAEAANRSTEIRPDLFQGPVPEFLLPAALRRAMKQEPVAAPVADCMAETSGAAGSKQTEMEAVSGPGIKKTEDQDRGAAPAQAAEQPRNPACRRCGGATVGKGKHPSGKRRLRCRDCGKSQLAEEKPPAELVPCPRCGGPSARWGRAGTGSPVRRCVAPECGRTWTVEKAPPRKPRGKSPEASEALRKVWANRDPATRTAIGRRAAKARLAKQPHSARSAGSRKAQEPMGPEARRERGRAGARACHALPEDRRRAMIEKRSATCAAKRVRLAALRTELVYLAAPYSPRELIAARDSLPVGSQWWEAADREVSAVKAARFQAINRAAGELMAAGTHVYSPISHTHPIAEACKLPAGWEFWEAYDRAMLSRCSRMIVLQFEGWEASVGVAAEIRIAGELGLRVDFQALGELESSGREARLTALPGLTVEHGGARGSDDLT